MALIIIVLCFLLFGSTLCVVIPSGDFIRVFVDNSHPLPEQTMSDQEVLTAASAIDIEVFVERVRQEYHSHCSQLCPELSVRMNQTWPVALSTDADYADFIDDLNGLEARRFIFLPPGRLRQDMCKEYQSYMDLDIRPDIFDNMDSYYPDILHNDFFKIYNEWISCASLGKLKKFFGQVNLDASPLGRLINPVHYHKVCMSFLHSGTEIVAKRAAQLSIAFARPFLGAEAHYSMDMYNLYVASWLDFVDDTSLFRKALPALPAVTSQQVLDMTDEYLEMVLEGLLIAIEYKDPWVDIQDPKLLQFVLNALENLPKDRSSFYKSVLAGDLKSKLELVGPLHIRYTETDNAIFPNDIVADIARFCRIPAELSRAHRVSPYSDGPANPNNFLFILTGNNPSFFLERLNVAPRFLTSDEVNLVTFITKIVHYDNLIQSHTESSDHMIRPLKETWRVSHLLHSLFFKQGAFGAGLNSGLRHAYMALAKLMYPKLFVRLTRLTHRYIHDNKFKFPRVMDLMNISRHNIDHSWVVEHYLYLSCKSYQNSPLKHAIDKSELDDFVKFMCEYAKWCRKQPSMTFLPRVATIIRHVARFGCIKLASPILCECTNNPKSSIEYDIDGHEFIAVGPLESFFNMTHYKVKKCLKTHKVMKSFSIQSVEFLIGKAINEDHRFNWSKRSAALHIGAYARRIITGGLDKDKRSEYQNALIDGLEADPYFREDDFEYIFAEFSVFELHTLFKDAYDKIFNNWTKDKTIADARARFVGKQNRVTMERCFDRLVENGKTAKQAMEEIMSLLITIKNSGLAKLLIEMADKKGNST